MQAFRIATGLASRAGRTHRGSRSTGSSAQQDSSTERGQRRAPNRGLVNGGRQRGVGRLQGLVETGPARATREIDEDLPVCRVVAIPSASPAPRRTPAGRSGLLVGVLLLGVVVVAARADHGAGHPVFVENLAVPTVLGALNSAPVTVGLHPQGLVAAAVVHGADRVAVGAQGLHGHPHRTAGAGGFGGEVLSEIADELLERVRGTVEVADIGPILDENTGVLAKGVPDQSRLGRSGCRWGSWTGTWLSRTDSARRWLSRTDSREAVLDVGWSLGVG